MISDEAQKLSKARAVADEVDVRGGYMEEIAIIDQGGSFNSLCSFHFATLFYNALFPPYIPQIE